MKLDSVDGTIERAIPQRWLAAAFLLTMALAWVFPSTPSGDGPFQTLNWIARIKAGQMPGRDFDVFHGVGLLWTHALLAVPFRAIQDVLWVHYLGSALAQWLLWSCVFRGAGRRWRQAFLAGAALMGVMSLMIRIPYMNIGRLVGARNSMIGARTALSLLSVYLAYRMGERVRGRGWWWFAVVMGVGAGIGGWFATDQAMSSLAMGLVAAITFAGSVSPASVTLRSARMMAGFLLALGAAGGTYIAFLWLSTGGAVRACLSYWWQFIPQVQFWWFGGPPSDFFHQVRDLLDPQLLLFPLAGFGLHFLGVVLRKPGQWPLRLGLLAYGLVSMLPLLAVLSYHYYSGLWCTGMIGLICARWPNEYSERLLAVIPARAIRIALTTACVVFFAAAIHYHWASAFRCRYPEQLRCDLAGSASAEIGDAVPEFVKVEHRERPSRNLLRAFYRSVPEIVLGQSGVGRFDYIIHAISAEQQADYRHLLEASPPVFLRVPTQKDFGYTQWLWHQWPELWETTLWRYRFEGLHLSSAYWRLTGEAKPLQKAPLGVHVREENGCVVIGLARRPAAGSLLHLTVTYRTRLMKGPLAGPLDKMTRVVVRPSGVLDDQAFAWPPGPRRHVREVFLVPKSGSDVQVRLCAEGPILSSGLEVEGVVAEEVFGADVEGLAKTLQP